MPHFYSSQSRREKGKKTAPKHKEWNSSSLVTDRRVRLITHNFNRCACDKLCSLSCDAKTPSETRISSFQCIRMQHILTAHFNNMYYTSSEEITDKAHCYSVNNREVVVTISSLTGQHRWVILICATQSSTDKKCVLFLFLLFCFFQKFES